MHDEQEYDEGDYEDDWGEFDEPWWVYEMEEAQYPYVNELDYY